jgi:phosphoenolpyruvate carboxykinase (ATP)
VDGCIGNVADFRTPARLTIEKANANVAGMQQKLYYAPDGGEPEVHVIYTPNLAAPGYPDDRVIAVDLEGGVTRILNSDYFGESKKGGLRMWNTIIYDRSGLALHAGCKVVPVAGQEKVFLIIGLSGTGKTTTTFTIQNDSLPVQDDFVALMPGGKVYGTENGCFAKTFSLDPELEPNIYNAVTRPDAYLENVYQDDDGKVNFFETSYTPNGRSVFGMDALGRWKDPRELGRVDHLLILNRNENIIPAVARLNRAQAAAYFMLGETTGTSAGGAAEEGKFLRVPGTNPFFPLRHGQQGNRILELLDSHPIEVFLMNTGRVGGRDDDDRSKKVKIPHSSAVVKGIAEETISWTEDEDFGYQVAESVPGIDDAEMLQPRRLYERQGRSQKYGQLVERFKAERVEFLHGFPDLDEEIIKAVG